jgi:hypothetical protein
MPPSPGRTKAPLALPSPCIRFRDSAVTSLGETDPELVWLAPALLHHADRRIAERHYDQARDSRGRRALAGLPARGAPGRARQKTDRVGAGRSRSGER